MNVTVFQSTKTTGKIPFSPFGDSTFQFESIKCETIKDVFFHFTANFILNIPLIKNTKTYRRKENLENLFVKTLDYGVLDLDGITKLSDRSICVNWFKESGYECIIAESRNPLNLKGIIKLNNLTPQEYKEFLKSLELLPCKVDKSVINYASYQAPIMKSEILYQGGIKEVQKQSNKLKDLRDSKDSRENLIVTLPDNLIDICKKTFIEEGFTFLNVGPKGYKCSHTSEKKSPGGFNWNENYPFVMNHWNIDRKVDIWSRVTKTPEYKNFYLKRAKSEIKKLMPLNSEGDLDRQFLGPNPEIVKNFLDSFKILRVQSPMGTAKSSVISEVLKQSSERELRVLLITNRISLADDISKKYDNIKHYQWSELEGKYQIGDNLVCQINSLWKYSLKYFDVVIIDEVTSLLFQLISLEKNAKNIITKLFATSNKKIVLLDAFIFEPFVKLFGTSVISIDNSYRDSTELLLYKNIDRWMYEIISKAKESNCITVSSGSTIIIKTLENLFRTLGVSYFTVSSETTKAEKELVYKEFTKVKPRWQVIMYSPSITVGISILSEANDHFHLDRGNSMDVVSSIQMIKRNRKAKNIHLLLQERVKYNITDEFKLYQELIEFAENDDDGDTMGISDVGIKFAKIKQVYNTLENRHMISFLYLLNYQFKNPVKLIEEIKKPFVSKLIKATKKLQIEKDLELFEVYKKMSKEELSDIEYSLFNKTKQDEKIKLFNKLIMDETLRLPKEDLELLIQEEIKTPGIIDSYKKILNNNIVSSDNNYSFNIKNNNLFKKIGINLKEYGYKKEKHIFRLNSTIKHILESGKRNENK